MSAERVTVRELRNHTSALLDRVRDGDALEVTRRGEVVARLLPPDPRRQAMDDLIRRGVIPPDWEERQRELKRTVDFGSMYTPPPGSPSAEELISEGREERL